MGDFYPDPNRPGRWIYDELAPSPGVTPPPTSMLPVIQPLKPTPYARTARPPVGDEHHEGHVDPDEFPDFSGVDSLMIRSIGAPD